MMHLFNNYYQGTGTMLDTETTDGIYQHGYCIASVYDANVVVEDNYFENVI